MENNRTDISNLTRYILAAVLARTATGGSAVAIILLARSYGADGKIAGALAACLTAPHIFGPVYGRLLDESRDPRLIIAGASLAFCIFFQLAILCFEWQFIWLTFCFLLVCGVCSSFMMGGLSTQLISLVEDKLTARRRAQSWDTLTFGFGLTMGPLFIATLTSIYPSHITIASLMSLPALAGVVILSLPKRAHASTHHADNMPGFGQVIAILRQSGPLKRTLAMTSGAAFSIATLPVLAVYLSEAWQLSKENGALLVTLYGAGCLCGAAFLMYRPMKTDAIILLRNVGSLLLGSLILVALSQSFTVGLATYWLCGVVNSIFFAVTLAARTEYAPRLGAGQIYMWVAAAKITAASLGTFFAGLLVDMSMILPFFVACIALATVLLGCFWPQRK